MADGQVLIDSKLDSGGVKKGAKEIEKDFSQLAKVAKKTADVMERELRNIDVDNVADGMSESFEAEGREITQVLEETSTEARENANEISNAYERAANEQASSMREAWAKTKAESASGSRKVISDLDDIGDKAQSVGGGLSSSLAGAFKSIAGAAVVYFGAEEIIEAGLGAINAAADVRAENAQFTQTFKELESTATASLNSISKQTGITASRMKKSYTGIYAFSKSIGADSSQALDISNRAMVAAADSAAYYDRSLEDTTETLQSFLKGNYENDTALNVACTETTRNAKANEMYAKSFDKLTEAQKVDVLLAMVEAANEASGALGQAARESDAWANVTGELKEAWRQFTAVLGEPVMDAVTPILQGVTTELNNLTEKAKDFKISDLFGDTDLGPITESLDGLKTSFGNLATTIGGDLKAAYDNVLAPLGTWTIEKGLPATIDAVAAAFNALDAAAEYLEPLGSAVWNNFLKPLGSFAGEGILAILDGLATGFGNLSTALSNMEMDSVELFGRIAYSIAETFFPGLFDPAIFGINQVGDAAKSATADVEGMGDATAETMDKTTEAALAAKKTNVERFKETASEIAAAGEVAADDWDTYMGSMEESSERVTGGIGGYFGEAGDAGVDAASTVSGAWSDAATTMENTTQKSVAKIQGWLDSLIGPTVYIDIVTRQNANTPNIPGAGGTVPSAASYEPAAYSITPEIPYLASGAVIPPNAPFLAVLGDQRNGTNIEAPLDTIKQAVAEVIGTGWDVTTTVNFEGTMAQFVRYLYPEIRSEISRRGGSLAEEVVV